MSRSWVLAFVLSMSGTAWGMEDAVPDSTTEQPQARRSALDPGRWSIDRGYPGEVCEKLLFGLTDVVTAPIELVLTPFARAYWADSDRRPVLEFFALGVPEGAMNAYFRAWEGVGNLATFPIASPKNRFSNYSIWYWDRYRADL